MNDAVNGILVAYLRGDLPVNIALMRLFIETREPAELEELLAAGEHDFDDPARARRARLIELSRANPGALDVVRRVMREADHAGTPTAGDDPVAHWAAIFDRLARAAPEAGVALYALGSPDLLAAATDELVALIRGWELVGPETDVLEIGCGIGRLALGLAPYVRRVVGLDVSGEMIAEAARRGAGVSNATFRQSSGRDLSDVASASVDLVLAADVFPYLVAAGADLARTHVAEAARVLRPGGALLVLNYSYRGDLDGDRRDIVSLCAAADLVLERAGTRDLALWDAAAFLARKPAARRATPP